MRKALCSMLAAFITLISLSEVQAAGDPAAGEKIFKANCVACHAGGKNAVNPAKNLQKEALVKYKMYSAEAIKTQVYNGKAAMPAFGKTGRLKAPDIENVAAYVLSQADKGWK